MSDVPKTAVSSSRTSPPDPKPEPAADGRASPEPPVRSSIWDEGFGPIERIKK